MAAFQAKVDAAQRRADREGNTEADWAVIQAMRQKVSERLSRLAKERFARQTRAKQQQMAFRIKQGLTSRWRNPWTEYRDHGPAKIGGGIHPAGPKNTKPYDLFDKEDKKRIAWEYYNWQQNERKKAAAKKAFLSKYGESFIQYEPSPWPGSYHPPRSGGKTHYVDTLPGNKPYYT